MDFLSSNSMTLMEKSMGFLWTKQAATLDNISNAETPNYKPKEVSFESSLTEKLVKAGTSSKPRTQVASVLEDADFAVVEEDVTTRMDDNGVNITEESVEMIRNAYQLQYVMSSINSQFSILRTAITG
jgi:flagellar basal-body rod protein FlgB